jgi:hypothetical protein
LIFLQILKKFRTGLNNQVEQSEPVETGEQEEGKEDEPQLDDDNADVIQPKPENQD